MRTYGGKDWGKNGAEAALGTFIDEGLEEHPDDGSHTVIGEVLDLLKYKSN